MGVQGLWELLAPVGRRVSVETLAGKKLAIDASIWMVQFMKAMRDEKGEMLRHAHLLGFFRRICKLLFLRTRPVFVFDGGTPALKRRTVAARRRHRENARAKIRKTAEKLLLNHLKAKKLEELAVEIKNSRAEDDRNRKGKSVVSNHENVSSGTSIPSGTDESLLGAISQEGLDEMLAASLAAEEEGKFNGDEPGSSSKFPSKAQFDEDEDEEMAIPVIDGNVDPTVLASLPPSMQLDLLVQMRERLMAENRQKYQKIKKSPSKFSELQIHSYLKTVAFRREIDEVQKFAAGRGPEGVQTSRIASESNREFIFSSSFTGDKRVFTSAGVERNENTGTKVASTRKESMPADSLRNYSSSSQLKSTDQVNVDEPTDDFSHDIETFRVERGRIRVSRVRGLGIRMTRDLQRNLDLMKEYETDNSDRNVYKNMEPIYSKETVNVPHNCSKNESPMDRKDVGELSEDLNRFQKDRSCEPSTVENDATLEVSFSVDDTVDKDDDLFSQLVAGNSNGCESDFDWEEGMIENKVTINKTNSDNLSQSLFEEKVTSEDDGLNWEEEEFQTTTSAHQIEHTKPISRGSLEEEFEVQEAIRRSLEDLCQQSGTVSILQAQAAKESLMDSSPVPLHCDGQESSQHTAIVGGLELPDSAVQSCSLQNVDSVKKQCSTMMSVHHGGKLSTADVPSRSFQVPNVFETHSETDCVVMERSQMDKFPTTVVVEVQNSEQEVCLDTSTKGDDKTSLRLTTDASIPVSSDVCMEGDLDSAHGTVQLDGHKTSEEEGYICDNRGFQAEILESTLDEELSLLSRERKDLGDEQRKLERNAESVNNEMFAECQELLQMFGLPFIIAPMEAEAQCAYMELLNLVDGVVTDDSDVFLFGAQNVYKNIFDDRKYVETYLMKDIENELGLTREKLIRMALLLGSDYTEGVSGIGIVNAIEVVHAFPEEDGFKKFREWVESPDPAILGKLYPHIGDEAKKRLPKVNGTDGDGLGSTAEGSLSNEREGNDAQSSSDDMLDVKKTFMDKHRNVSKNWHMPSSFPSESVVSAYTNPQVDESTESFTWGKPDLPLLRKLCWEKFGWANQKADELLVPVLKEYNKHETQLRLEAFYTFNEKFAKIRSKRIKRAVKGITGNSSIELVGDLEVGNIEVKKKRRRTSEVEEDRCEKHSDGKCDSRKASRQLKVKSQKLSGERHEDSLVQGQRAVNETNKSIVNGGRGRGRGKQGGRGRGNRGGRGRKRETGKERSKTEEHSVGSTETSSSDCSYHSTEKEKQVETTCSSELRRSVRQRKHVQYADEENMGADENSDFPESRSENCVVRETAAAEGPTHCSNSDDDNNDHDVGITGEGFSESKHTTDRDFLLSGGGFCIDDDDDDLNDKNVDMKCSFDGNLKDIQEPVLPTPARHEEADHFTKEEAGHQTGYAFTAMTSLRRKRK